MSNGIHKINSQNNGPTLAIFAGVHGNELAGVYALRKLLPTLSITRGTLYLVFANPDAITANKRMLKKNLNRCFIAGNVDTENEDIRARELMAILDKCDALLDLHMYYDDDGEPFVICEESGLELANKMDTNIISTNWTEVEPGGTDGYMHENGKVGICFECGPLSKADAYTSIAIKTIFQFLKYYGMTNVEVEYSDSVKKIIEAQKVVYKTSDGFALKKGFYNFAELTYGQTIAVDVDKEITAGKDECIIFPHYGARVGEEAYIIGKIV